MKFDSKLAVKEIKFFLIINLALLPLLVLLSQDLMLSYFLVIAFEGFCSLVLGGFELFFSLFSTMERENHRYIGHRMMRYQLKVIELEPKHKEALRRIGFTLVIMGLLFLLSLMLIFYGILPLFF